jgi:hypothetical protein
VPRARIRSAVHAAVGDSVASRPGKAGTLGPRGSEVLITADSFHGTKVMGLKGERYEPATRFQRPECRPAIPERLPALEMP